MPIEPSSEAARANMRVTFSILLILSLAGAYALGRLSVGTEGSDAASELDLASVASFRASLEQPDALERSYRFHGFLQTLSPSDIGEASEVVEAWSPWLVEDELLNFMIAWARFDAPEAFEWARLRTGPFRAQASAAALEAWAFHDPADARRGLESVDPPSDRVWLEEYFVAGWLTGGHHDAVIEYITAEPPGSARQRYTNLLTIELMRGGPDTVIGWVESIPNDAPGAFKRMAFQKAANILATVDPIQASRWIQPHLGEDYAEDAPNAIVRRWVEVDPKAALTWLASLPPGPASDDALQGALRVWRSRAPEEAEAWVRGVSEEGGGSAAIAAMISLHADDPPGAIAWAQRIPEPADRNRTVVRLARTWHRSDPEAAERWLEESALSPAMRSAILKPRAAKRRRDGLGVSEAVEARPEPSS
jgi:hypothetical protein